MSFDLKQALPFFAKRKEAGRILKEGRMLNNSKMRLAAFLDYETLFSLSGVSLVRFLPTGARNEQGNSLSSS